VKELTQSLFRVRVFEPTRGSPRLFSSETRILITIPRLHYMQRGKNERVSATVTSEMTEVSFSI